MKRYYLVLILTIIYVSGLGQTNLVINPGFEETNYTSTGVRELNKAGYISNYWYSPLDKRSPHLFMVPERSVAKAHGGRNALGMILGSSKTTKTKFEYITGELSKPLIQGQAYCVSFHILLHRSSKWAATDVGVLFHHDHELIANADNPNLLDASLYVNDRDPVSNTKWLEYNGYYVASGGEKYISFGTFGVGEAIEIKELGLNSYFQVDAFNNKAYYQIDDVSVIAKGEGVDCGCATPPIIVEGDVNSDLPPYLFALDASGSMKKDGVFDSLRNNLVDLLEQLPFGTPVTFSTFSEKSNLIFAGKLGVGTTKKVDSLLAAIELGGGTSVSSGLENAARSWESSGKDSARIVLISDGSFSVSSKIENIVKGQYENKGRKLTVIQIAKQPKGSERLEPYQTSFIIAEISELRNAVFQIHKPKRYGMIACNCIDAYSDTMNYHFIIDYSGSMKMFRNRAKKVVLKLYEQVPPTAVVSITAFSTEATQLFMGRKSEMSLSELENLLESHAAKGGTDPGPGVINAVNLAEEKADGRFSHLILVTDLEPDDLNQQDHSAMKSEIRKMSEKIDLAVSSVTVDLETQMDLWVSGRAQFDIASNQFRPVSTRKFENDLFETIRSGCDYTTQPYHYNPVSDIAKDASKKTFRLILKELLGVGISVSTGS